MYINCKIIHVCADLGIVVGGGGVSSVEKQTYHSSVGKVEKVKRGSRRGWGGVPYPLENHKLYGVL